VAGDMAKAPSNYASGTESAPRTVMIMTGAYSIGTACGLPPLMQCHARDTFPIF
jgi:hypothetical protein